MEVSFVMLLRPFLRISGDAVVGPDAKLRDLGLDSMRAVDLLFALEDEYAVMISEDELTDAAFDTPRSLWAVVERARADAAIART